MTKIRYTQVSDYLTGTPGKDDWTAERMALFLTTLAQTGLVSAACEAVGMSEASAYTLRRSRRGLVFSLGWKAAHLLARDVLEDKLLNPSKVATVTRREGNVTYTRRFDKKLAMAVLNRLEQQAVNLRDKEIALARSIAGSFAEYVEMIASGGGEAALAEFLSAHPDPLAAQVAALRPQ